jgi:hypothetical protein
MRDERILCSDDVETGLARRRVIGLVLRWGMLALAGAGAGMTPAMAAAAARRERRQTLDPERFVGKARAAHLVARESPDLLDQLYCYCECDKSIGHKSLLSCYTDGHAAT